MKKYAENCERGFTAIEHGSWIIFWGNSPSDHPKENFDIVLGHEARVPDGFGWILTADGSGISVFKEDLRDYMSTIPISHEIWRMYAQYCQDNTRTPKRMEELEKYRRRYPSGFAAVQGGSWQVRWGTKISRDDTKNAKQVLAYEKQVPTATDFRGGWVVMADNLSLRMSSHKFNNANWDD